MHQNNDSETTTWDSKLIGLGEKNKQTARPLDSFLSKGRETGEERRKTLKQITQSWEGLLRVLYNVLNRPFQQLRFVTTLQQRLFDFSFPFFFFFPLCWCDTDGNDRPRRIQSPRL